MPDLNREALVSIVVPVFNGERHLEECLRSVLSQTLTRFEIVIADQNSSDRSLDIVRSLGDARIHILSPPSEPIGLHENWNRGIQACSGEFIKLLGQDDVLLPSCIEIQANLLREFPGAVLVCGRRRIIDDRGRTLIRARGLGKFARYENAQLLSADKVVREITRSGANLLGEPVSVLMRSALIPRPLFSSVWRYAVDLESYLRCMENGYAVLDRRVVCSFRVSPQQLSARLANSQASEVTKLLHEMNRRYAGSVTSGDVRRGIIRAHVLSMTRRLVYRLMRLRGVFTFLDAPRDGQLPKVESAHRRHRETEGT